MYQLNTSSDIYAKIWNRGIDSGDSNFNRLINIEISIHIDSFFFRTAKLTQIVMGILNIFGEINLRLKLQHYLCYINYV